MESILYLASSSPQRAALLSSLSIPFSVLQIAVDEDAHPNEDPKQYVLRVARLKGEAGWKLSQQQKALPVLAADTTVSYQGEIFGKPENYQDAKRIWQTLSGRTHHVYTGVYIQHHAQIHAFAVETEVEFGVISEARMLAYWETGEPQNKAGAYALQGRAAVFVKRINGSTSSVVGLPLYEVYESLTRMGVELVEHEQSKKMD